MSEELREQDEEKTVHPVDPLTKTEIAKASEILELERYRRVNQVC